MTCLFRRLRTIVLPYACALLLAPTALALGDSSTAKRPVCGVTDPTFASSTDIQAVALYEAAIRQLLTEHKFSDLDCIADAARSSKARFPNGGWKLWVLYDAIDEPQGHATDQDWRAHLKTLNRWKSANPRSITARVALAAAYIAYAWDARGSGYSDTVTQSGWKLFGQRIDKAKQVLEDASRLKSKCPHWYAVMQTVALAEGWDLARASALLEQAVAFEPEYHYYYRNYANYLTPRWNGEEGDPERFAEQAADRVGGVKGDILYFQIAVQLICHCSAETNLPLLSWPRIQSGEAELEKQYGESLTNLNLLAYMAIKERDGIVAHNLFARIGENWEKTTWRTRAYFDSCRDWAVANAAYNANPAHQVIVQAQGKFAVAIARCVIREKADLTKFALLLGLQKDGVVETVMPLPPTKAGLCLNKLKGQMVAPPPYAPFMFKIDVDPTQLVTAAH